MIIKKFLILKNNIIKNQKNNKNLNFKSLFNNKNNKNINKNDNNDKKNKNKNNNKENNEEEEINENHKELKNLPFRGARKISNIDIIYNENDRFVRRESEFYPFYVELLNARGESKISPNFKNDHLSNIIENNLTSEGNSNNEIGLTNNELNNKTYTSEENSNNEIAISNNGTKINNISEGNFNEIIITNNEIKNIDISLLNNTNKNNSASLLNNSNNKNNNYSILNLKKIIL